MQKQDLMALWASITHDLETALPEVRILMAAKWAQIGTLESDSLRTRAGLADGADIVSEYISHNELGLALEHLCYMIAEAQLPLSAQTYAALEAAGAKMQMPASLTLGLGGEAHST